MAGTPDVYRNCTKSVRYVPRDRIGYAHREALYDMQESPAPHDAHRQAEHGHARTLHHPVAESFVRWSCVIPMTNHSIGVVRRIPRHCGSVQRNQFSGAVRRPLQRIVRPCRIAPCRTTSPRAHDVRQRADPLCHLAWQEQAMQPT